MLLKMNLLEGLSITDQLVSDIVFLCETRSKPTYFTRASHCKMDFGSLLSFILNFVKKTLQVELDLFFQNIKGVEDRITKQGYSAARQKVLPIAFIKMADAIISRYYSYEGFNKFRGYRLLAIDASILELPNSERLRTAFGYSEGKSSVKLARAKASGIYDLENDMMVTSKITHYLAGEREVAIELIEKLKQLGLKNDLILFDRGYPSKDFIAYLEENHINYLMRVKKNWLISTATKPDQVIQIPVDGKPISVRVLRLILDSGEEEILITNLLNENFTTEEFKELYFKRWGIEVKYNELKNRLQIENFTGDTPIAIEQDFYASIYLSNMVALAKSDANEEIKQNNQGKDLKYEYKVNTNVLIGKLKDSLVLMLLEDDPEKRIAMLHKIIREISKNMVPIRPGRSKARRKGLRAQKHPVNYKKSL